MREGERQRDRQRERGGEKSGGALCNVLVGFLEGDLESLWDVGVCLELDLQLAGKVRGGKGRGLGPTVAIEHTCEGDSCAGQVIHSDDDSVLLAGPHTLHLCPDHTLDDAALFLVGAWV